MFKRAVYAGSFDPITNGHCWMIEQGSKLFDELIIAVGVNPDKKGYFPVEDRVALIKASVGHLTNVRVDSFVNRYLIDYSKDIGAEFILRGIRNTADFEFERTMRYINADLNPKISTIFLTPPREIADISSSMVRGLIGPEGWQEIVRRFVPQPVFNKLTGKKS